MLRLGASRAGKAGTGSSRDPKPAVRRSPSGVTAVLALQRTYGNAFVQRLMQRKPALSQPDDSYEQKADRVAGAVVRRNAAAGLIAGISCRSGPAIYRICGFGNRVRAL